MLCGGGAGDVRVSQWKSADARFSHEAGARVSVNIRVQDMDLSYLDAWDNRFLEMEVDGLSLC